jgi:DNA-binding NtrC family response regulator
MAIIRIIWLYSGHLSSEFTNLAGECEDHSLVAMSLADGLEYLSAEGAEALVVNLPIEGWTAERVIDAIRRAAPAARVIIRDASATSGHLARLRSLGAHLCAGTDVDETEFTNSVLGVLRDNAPAGADPRKTEDAWRRSMVGESRSMQEVLRLLRLAGPRRCTVLIGGESGTGKELAAKALHGLSERRKLPMVAVNCSAIPENLIESELFGHVRGAFTGAMSSRAGRFEQAHRSTLFLDEIADLPLDLQAKLLRVLQERELQRLGSSETIRVDVRIIAASNVNLLDRVSEGKFREDLYYRLNVVPIRIPALRERLSDIPLLARHFLDKVCASEGLPSRTLGPGVLERLCACPWPGNIRQLENAIEMAVVMSGDRRTLSLSDFEAAFPGRPGLTVVPDLTVRAEFDSAPAIASLLPDDACEGTEFEEAVRQFERTLIERAVRTAEGNKSKAARILGLKRTTLICKLKALEDEGPVLAAASA